MYYIALFEGIGLRDHGDSMLLRNLGASNCYSLQKHQLRPLLAQKPLWQTEHLRINSYFVPPPFLTLVIQVGVLSHEALEGGGGRGQEKLWRVTECQH
jgi:hypothetical protein